MRRWPLILLACTATGVLLYAAMLFTGGDVPAPFQMPEAEKSAQPAPIYDWQTGEDFVVAFGKVDVLRGSARLSFPIPGRITKVNGRDGDHVVAGQPIIELDLKSAQADLEAASATLLEAEARKREAEANRDNYPLRLEQQRQVLTTALAGLEVEKRQLDRLRGVGDKTVGSVFNMEVQEQRVIAQEATVQSEKLRLEQMNRDDPKIPLQAAQAAVDRARAQRDVAQAAMKDRILAAPSDGTILRINARVGEIVSPASPDSLVWFVEDAPRIVRCEVNHRFASRIQPGMAATCYRDDSETLLGKGTVQSVSPWIADQRELTTKPFQRTDQRTLECIIAFDEQPEKLWIGERVRVVIKTVAPASPESTSPEASVTDPIQAER